MTDQELNAVSLKPADQTRGGLIDDVDGEAIEHRFVLHNYGGKIADMVPGLRVRIRPAGGTDADIVEQYYSAGDKDKFFPSDDGLRLLSKGAAGINDNCNTALYLNSVVAAGFPEDKLTAEISCLDGMVAHFKREAQPNRGGLIKPQAEGEKKKSNDYLKVSKILTMPWDNKNKGKSVVAGAPTSAKAAGGAPKGAPAAAAGGGGGTLTISDDAREKAMNLIVEMLGEEEYAAGIKTGSLGVQVLKRLKGDPDAKAITGFISKPEFLGEEGQPWTFDAATKMVTAS